MRYAIYHTPERSHPLSQAALNWLGRDSFGGPVTQPFRPAAWTRDEHEHLVADAARYGFHATLKAPFALAQGKSVQELEQAFWHLDTGAQPPVIPALALRQIDGFFALVPADPVDAVHRLAALIVREFDDFRAPLANAERTRRKPENLSERQRIYLEDWGYPYVFDDFFFHMTVTARVPTAKAAPVRSALEEHFADFIGKPHEIGHIALFTEAGSRADFKVTAIRPVGFPAVPLEEVQKNDR